MADVAISSSMAPSTSRTTGKSPSNVDMDVNGCVSGEGERKEQQQPHLPALVEQKKEVDVHGHQRGGGGGDSKHDNSRNQRRHERHIPYTKGGSGSLSDRTRTLPGMDSKVDFLFKLKYLNGLPDIPFNPKCMVCPFEEQQHSKYAQTSLEREYRHSLHTEPNVCLPLDLVDPSIFAGQRTSHAIDDRDKALVIMAESKCAGMNGTLSGRSKMHQQNIPFFLRTQYISSEYKELGTQKDAVESKMGLNIKDQDDLHKGRDEQITVIDRTFSKANSFKIGDRHPVKTSLRAKEVVPLLPDFDLWAHEYVQVKFSEDPANKPPPHMCPTDFPNITNEQLSRGVLKCLLDENRREFMGLFVPTAETLDRSAADENTFKDEKHVCIHEYDNPKALQGEQEQEHHRQRNFVFIKRDGAVFYNQINQRMQFFKRRNTGVTSRKKVTTLNIKERELSEEEHQQENRRLLQLIPDVDDDLDDLEIDASNGGGERINTKRPSSENEESDDNLPSPKRSRDVFGDSDSD